MPIPQNRIPERQNSERAIKLLASSSQLYSQTKIVTGFQLLLTVIFPVILSVLAIIFPNQKVWAAFYGIVLSVADVLLFQELQNEWKKEAAKVQELFDCELLEMDWNEFKIGDKPSPERVNRSASRYLENVAKREKLLNWYSEKLEEVPLYLARIIAQRTNIVWDSSLRRMYANWLTAATLLVLLLLCIIGIAVKMDLTTFVLSIMAPLSPTVLWAIREVRKQKDSAETLVRLQKNVQSLWTNARDGNLTEERATLKSRELQDEIYFHRSSNQPIFNWIHKLTRTRFEEDMNVAAEELVKETQNLH
jgi:hypothetical protein